MELPASAHHLQGLRVLAFCDYFAAHSSGGAERVALEVYRRLLLKGGTVEVLAIQPRASKDVIRVSGIPTHVVPGRDLSRAIGVQMTVAASILRIARKVLSDFKPDVVHVSGIHFLGSLIGAHEAKLHRIPLVVTAHVGSVDALPPAQRLPARLYEKLAGHYILTRAAHVIAVSGGVADHVAGLGAKNIHVIPNGVDHQQFAPRQRVHDAQRVVFVGRLIANKGPLRALQAYATLRRPEVQMTFVGDGPMRKRLEVAAARLGVAGSVEFLGQTDDVSTVLAQSDIFIRPSTTEGGLSLSTLEAMAVGLPVLVSAIAENVAKIDSGVSGILVDPADTKGLARELDRLLKDAALRRRIGKAGRALALNHSWETCAEKTVEVLAEAAAGQ